MCVQYPALTACVARKYEKLENYIDIYKTLSEPSCSSTNYTYECIQKNMLEEEYQDKRVISEPRNIISRYIYFYRTLNGFVEYILNIF